MFWVRLTMRIVLYSALLLSLMTNGCTTINIIKERMSKIPYIDSDLRKYAYKFADDARTHKTHILLNEITIVFGHTNTKEDPGVVGTCASIGFYPVITIDETYWAFSDEYAREELMYHELGHCLLARDHCEIKENGESVSLMEPEMIGSVLYKKNRENLVNELFKPNAGCGGLDSNSNGVHLHLH